MRSLHVRKCAARACRKNEGDNEKAAVYTVAVFIKKIRCDR